MLIHNLIYQSRTNRFLYNLISFFLNVLITALNSRGIWTYYLTGLHILIKPTLQYYWILVDTWVIIMLSFWHVNIWYMIVSLFWLFILKAFLLAIHHAIFWTLVFVCNLAYDCLTHYFFMHRFFKRNSSNRLCRESGVLIW